MSGLAPPGGPRLAGQVAVITGAARGIGRATLVRLSAEGAAVVAVDLDRAGAEAAADEVVDAGGTALWFGLDVADVAAMAAALDETVARLGRLDVLDNNAAAFEPEVTASDVDVVSTPLSTWDRTFDVNLRGPMAACKHAIPHMLATAGGGSIINISSTAAFLGDLNHVAYKASKAGLQALTRSIATSHGKRGIRCNAVATGLVLSETAQENLSSPMLDAYERNRLLTKAGTPEQVAALVAYLVSPEAAYVTGQTFVIDGGASIHQPWYSVGEVVHPEAIQPDGLPGAVRAVT